MVLFCLALLPAACATAAAPTTAASDPPPSAPPPERLIVKIRDATRMEETYQDLQRQAREAGATLEHVRTLYGNVHLYQIAGTDADTFALLLQRFAAHANVDYVEPDRVMRHQAPRIEKQ